MRVDIVVDRYFHLLLIGHCDVLATRSVPPSQFSRAVSKPFVNSLGEGGRMSAIKRPGSLRYLQMRRNSNEGRASTATSIIAACMATSAVTPALAQSPGSQTELPALNVETSAPKRAKPAPKKSPSPAEASPSQQTSSAPEATPAGTTAAGGNPNADPAAPYKVDRSANTKLTQPLLDTPRTVTVVPKEVLEQTQTTSVRELARTTPGVTLGTGEGGNAFGDVLFIRGFRASNDAYIDGVRDPGVTIRENFMTEQVEILKGPSSSVAGRGTTGGAINVVTKKPQEKDFTNVTTTLGTDSTKRVTADVNKALTPNLWFRGNGMWQEANVAGRDEVFDDRWGGAAALTWKPSDALTFTVDYYHLSLNGMPDWGVPYDLHNRRPFTESGLSRDTFYGVLARDFLKGEQDIVTFTTEAKLSPGVTLTNKLRKGKSTNDYVVSAPERPITTNPDPSLWTLTSAAKSRFQQNEILANQTDVRWDFATGFAKHTMVAGLEFSRENVSRDTYRNLDTESFVVGNIPGCSVTIFFPDTSGCWGPTSSLIRAGNPTDIQIDTQSGYLLDTITLTPNWILNGGVRLDNYAIELDNRTTHLERNDTMINYNAGITYKPFSYASFYFAYGTSTNPVGQELDAGGDDYGGFTARSVLLGPERNVAMELGTKWELFDRHLLLTAALFQTTKENARETVGSGPTAQLLDTGEYRVQGVEFGVAGKVTERLSLYGGAVFMDSEVTKSENPINVGAEFANIAHTQFSLLGKYQLTDRLSVGARATHAGEIKGGTFAATNGNELPAHWRFDAMAEYQLTKNVDVRLNVLNLTDEVYYEAFYRSGTPYVYVAPGRAAYLTTSFKF